MKETIFDKEYNLDEYKWDERLSLESIGLMAVLTKYGGAVYKIEDISKRHKHYELDATLEELETYGYIKREAQLDKNKLFTHFAYILEDKRYNDLQDVINHQDRLYEEEQKEKENK